MAENEKRLVENLSKLPGPLKDEFLSQIQGAATAVKVLSATPPEDPGGEIPEKGS